MFHVLWVLNWEWKGKWLKFITNESDGIPECNAVQFEAGESLAFMKTEEFGTSLKC